MPARLSCSRTAPPRRVPPLACCAAQASSCLPIPISLGLHIASWKTFGVEVAQEVKDEINALTRDKLRPQKLTRLNALGALKSDQFELLEHNWEKLIEYLGCTSGEQFAEDTRAAQPSQPTSISTELLRAVG